MIAGLASARLCVGSSRMIGKPSCPVPRGGGRHKTTSLSTWIKGHLRIRAFVGTSENAVRIQIWTALSTYLLVAILKKTLKLEPSLHEILQVLSVTSFEKVPVPELFAQYSYSDDTSSKSFNIPNSLF
jgi:hypothetical protein